MSDLLNYTDDSYYPYVVLPPQAYNLLQQPPLPALELPKEPRKPVRPQPPDKPPLNRSLAIGLLCFLISLTVVLIVSGMPWFVWTILALFALSAWDMVTSINTYPQRLASYEEGLADYQQAMAQYNDQLAAWKERCTEMERENQRKVEQILEDWLHQPLTGVKPREPDCVRIAPLGRFDNKLREALQQCSPQDIGMKILANYCSLVISGTGRCYTPDIAVQVSFGSTTLLIDVEVDEPWFFQNGERIAYHCLDDSRQLKRDCYFQQAGWIVIRFAEQQVSEDANLCAQFVVAVARHLLRSRRCTLPLMPCQKRWDRTNALQHSRP